MYDYIIIGAGPAGLTLAYYLSKYKHKVLLVDRENSIGGCHRVRRVDGLFSEHGPRIIIDNYFSLIDLLSDFNLKFDDIFAQYDYSVNVSTMKLISILSIHELLAFAYEFIKYPTSNMTMSMFTKKYNFSHTATSYIDIICRVSDGGTIDNYTLYEFLQIFNQNYLYSTYQPKLPNDIGLFAHWKKKLLQNGVTILLNTEIERISNTDHIITKDGTHFSASRYIFAIPPQAMIPILERSTQSDLFGNFTKLKEWEKDCRYLVYIPINFHWNEKLKLKKIQGITDTPYGLTFVVMSDYMHFNHPDSKTVITCTIKNKNRRSSHNNKNANECSPQELIDETLYQLNTIFHNMPPPTKSIISPGVYKNGDQWETIDQAYFHSFKSSYLQNQQSPLAKNIYWVGTHNGKSSYSFTSMESAMGNAISLLHTLEPKSKQNIHVRSPITVKQLFAIAIILFLVYKLKK